jgi:alpha-galactosidase
LAFSQTPGSVGISLDSWKATLPFSFTYDGKDSSGFLSTWTRTEETATSPGGQLYRCTFTDPATKLKVTAEVRTFTDYNAIDWVLKFANNGTRDTPIIENIEPLNWKTAAPDGSVLHSARGSDAKPNDFEPATNTIGKGQTVTLQSTGGRSSSTTNIPFFNLQQGDKGIVGAIGWTGNWIATFAEDGTGENLTMCAGMKKTHLLLHPGEEIRTPRIVLLNWEGGDVQASQNLWRRFVLAYYSIQAHGKPVVGPLCFGSWGTDPIANKLAQVKMIKDSKWPIDVYWVDAGWHGHSDGSGNDGKSPWWRNRGSWEVNPGPFPNGLKPLTDAVHAAHLGFLLWMEPEAGDPDTTLRVQHPDWWIMPPNGDNDGTALLNLGNKAARGGMEAVASKLITDTGMAWFRQDFNHSAERSWTPSDAPDRVGMMEIGYIEGLYTFWDDLRAKHPGLLIDNCSSGGRRIDIETLARTFPLWRSDLACLSIDPIVSQSQEQGLAPWVPLNGGAPWMDPGFLTTSSAPAPVIDNKFLYGMRSGYSTALVLGPGHAEGKSLAWCAQFKKFLDEYKEVQPYMYGDFYSFLPYDVQAENVMTAWQWDRPDKKAGVAMVLRRPDCVQADIELPLRALDPKAQYDVEIRTGLEKRTVKAMSGEALAKLKISIPDKPGSALVFYKKK